MGRNLDQVRERMTTIATTKYYVEMHPQELVELQAELNTYLNFRDPKRSSSLELTLWDLLFYVNILLSKDFEAQVIYNKLRDRFGEHSPNLYVMRVTLLEVNRNDKVAMKFINQFLDEVLEFDTDPQAYLNLSKKLISIQNRLPGNDIKDSLKRTLELIEKFPIDPELWWYAGELYLKMDQFDKAAYCFEEIVCIMPFNYISFTKIAETLYLKALSLNKKNNKDFDIILQKALDNALRSVELSELYVKGWSLVALISSKMNEKVKILNVARKNLKHISEISNEKDRITAEYILNNLD